MFNGTSESRAAALPNAACKIDVSTSEKCFCVPDCTLMVNKHSKIVGVVMPKKWSGQNLTDLTSDYGPVIVTWLAQKCGHQMVHEAVMTKD